MGSDPQRSEPIFFTKQGHRVRGRHPGGHPLAGLRLGRPPYAHPSNLFSDPEPDAAGKNFLDCLNPDSLEVLAGAKMEASLADTQPSHRFQFMRQGYFCADSEDSTPDHLVFNRAVSLKDGFKPQ